MSHKISLAILVATFIASGASMSYAGIGQAANETTTSAALARDYQEQHPSVYVMRQPLGRAESHARAKITHNANTER